MTNRANVSPRPTVLVIDDDPDLIQLFQDVLEVECEYVVAACPDRPPTVDEIRAARPDLLIIDHRLSHGQRGWDLVSKVRATPDLDIVPIVFCTSDSKYVSSMEADFEAQRVIPLLKPFSVDDLVGHVSDALKVRGIDPSPCP
ncbi:MAG: hypothetical protein NVS2B7_07500 [Herpetosiphon sp.]